MPATEQTWRNQKLLHIVFGVSALAMLVSTVWMLAADHTREWKRYQRKFREVEAWTTQQRKAAEESGAFEQRSRQLSAQLEEAKAQPPAREAVEEFLAVVREHAPEASTAEVESAYEALVADPSRSRREVLIDSLEGLMQGVRVEEDNLSRQMKFARADFEVVRSRYEAAVGAGAAQPELDRLQADVDRVDEQVQHYTLLWQEANTYRRALDAAYAAINAEVDAAAKALDDHLAESKRLEDTLRSQEWKLGDTILSLPIIDAFSSPNAGRPLKIEQIWLPELTLNNNFRDVARFDRCTTCHMGIDSTYPGTADQPGYPHAEEFDVQLQSPDDPLADLAEAEADESTDEEAEADEAAPGVPTLPGAYGMQLAEWSLEPSEVTIGVVEPGSLAARAGLETGDVIVQVRDVKVFDRRTAEMYLLERVNWGETIPLRIRRGVKHPHSSHPRLDLFVGSLSPHDVTVFGCTICHNGQGSATSFQWASHSPNTPLQMEQWRRDHGWFYNHHWILPMQPKRFAESTCLKCHHQVTELEPSERFPDPPAPKVTKGYELVKEYGCFGCHEINGWEGPTKSVGPDLRAEPGYFAAAQQLMTLTNLTDEEQSLARNVIAHPEDEAKRKRLASLIRDRQADDSDAAALSPEADKLVTMLGEDNELPGKMRKVGPSLRYVGSKVDMEFLYDWISEPKHFRPTTKMPQFFGLWDHFLPVEKVGPDGQVVTEPKLGPDGQPVLDEQGQPIEEPVMEESPGLELAKRYEPVEIYAISRYLLDASQPFEYLERPEGVTEEPSAERGKLLFEQRGCLACHKHEDFPGATSTQGPELSRIGAKLNTPDGARWLYSWLREPMRYHTRTVMPNLFLDPISQPQEDGSTVVTDPAADIAAYLLGSSQAWEPKAQPPAVDDIEADLDELAFLYLSGTFTQSQARKYLDNGIPESLAASLKGDEVVLVGEGQMSVEKKLNYVGRRSLAKYGCAGCHDIPGYEGAKPIGTGLADWGRKDPAQLAFEQVAEYLHKTHGGGHGDGHGHGHAAPTQDEAFFLHAVDAHHREGFVWQKLREPRSYDYRKTENKGYNDRLLMPKFPLDGEEIEAIVTFVLGLVADPPPAKYVYDPEPRQKALVEGKQVLEKYNCGGCHTLEMETWEFEYDPETFPEPLPFDDYAFLKPHFTPEELEDSKKTDRRGMGHAAVTGMPVVDAEGNPVEGEDDDGNPLYYFTLWENVAINGHPWVTGGAEVEIGEAQITRKRPPQGGELARLLYPSVLEAEKQINPNVKDSDAWGWVPPPLVGEGRKVQTNWLYEFLLDPYPIRPAVVLRMPKFNMSPEEASKLVDYFAAKDNVTYPYEFDARTRSEHLARAEEAHPGRLDDALKIVTNSNYCIQCHHVGDYVAKGSPKALAPNLDQVHDRLRPEFLRNWIANPKRLLPYTGMPVNFPQDKPADQNLFHGSSLEQIDAVVDLLLNFDSHLSTRTSITPMVQVAPEEGATDPEAGGGGE